MVQMNLQDKTSEQIPPPLLPESKISYIPRVLDPILILGILILLMSISTILRLIILKFV